MLFFFIFTLVQSQTTGQCGTNCTWTYDTNTKKITMNGFGEISDLEDLIDREWNKIIETIESVEISKGFTKIGNYVFMNGVSIKTVSLPETIAIIGKSAFENCIEIEKVELPENVVQIDQKAFKNCANLKDVEFGGKKHPVCDETVFNGCLFLKKVDVSKSYDSQTFCGVQAHIETNSNLTATLIICAVVGVIVILITIVIVIYSLVKRKKQQKRFSSDELFGGRKNKDVERNDLSLLD